MSIETDVVILMDENVDLADQLIGGLWGAFKESIPEPQTKILIRGFNLIILGEPTQDNLGEENEEDAVFAKTESLLPGMISNILVDESITVPMQKMAIFELITNNIIETLIRLGFTLNEDEVSHERLDEMCRVVQFFYEMDSYEDLVGIADVLQSSDIDTVDRFLLAMQKYLGEEADLEVYHLLLDDVSEVTLKTISDNLLFGEISEAMPETLVLRVRGNVELIRGTLAFDHVINNGQLGGSVESFINFFGPQLAELLNDQTEENVRQYCKEMTAIYLVSEVNTPVLKEQLMEYLYTIISNHQTLNQVESFTNQLVLDHD